MINPAFFIDRLPKIEFGKGTLAKVPTIAKSFGNRALIVTGGCSFIESEAWPTFTKSLQDKGLTWDVIKIANEPSPQLIDSIVEEHTKKDFKVVIGIGGGSVLDSAKAIAGLLLLGDSVMDYLEGVGPERNYTGPSIPFIAVPTTAGTGSEATKNAVLSQTGKSGFKKSFRHEQLVAQIAVVDPDLLKSCPPALIAANGMDALTQLIESYVSIKANPFTDALAFRAIGYVRDGLHNWYHNKGDTEQARSNMAYAAMISGITLAQVGLGSVHGLASPLGAYFPIPHGVVCGTLVATATEVNIQAMQSRDPENTSLQKYYMLASQLCRKAFADTSEACQSLVQLLSDWTELMQLPTLSHYGISESDFERVVKNARGSSMKTNPIVLTDEEILTILQRRI